MEKHRFAWKEACGTECVGAGSGAWTKTRTRTYIEPGATASIGVTGVTGVSRGDEFIREDFIGYYEEQVDSPCASPCSCPSGWSGGVASGHPEIRWYYHEHDPQAAGNPHIIQVDTCACSPCIEPPPDDPGGPDAESGHGHGDGEGDGDGDSSGDSNSDDSTHGDDTGTGDHSGHDNGVGW